MISVGVNRRKISRRGCWMVLRCVGLTCNLPPLSSAPSLCWAHLRSLLTVHSTRLSSNHVRTCTCKVSQSLCRVHGCSRFRPALVRRSHTLPLHAYLVLSNDSSRTSGEGTPVASLVIHLQSLGSFSAVECPPCIPPIHPHPPGKTFPRVWKRRRRGARPKTRPNAPRHELVSTHRTTVSTAS